MNTERLFQGMVHLAQANATGDPERAGAAVDEMHAAMTDLPIPDKLAVWCVFRYFKTDEALLGIYSTEAQAVDIAQGLRSLRRHETDYRYAVQKRRVE